MSRRARELGALNLGQGFPDYAIDPRLTQLVGEAMAAGHNQYAPMEGVVELREGIAAKLEECYGAEADPLSQITITLGATEALFSAIHAIVRAGDEVITFDPAYDSYEPAVTLAGGRCIRIPLQPPRFRFDWDRVRDTLSERTRLVILNSPHNPACTVASPQDVQTLADLIRDRNVTVLSDEVYEHVVFDGRRHISVLSHPELAARSYAVFSFGKTLHATGVRVGYAVAPAALTQELRKVHQFNTFSIAHPFQQAVAVYMREKPEAWRNLSAFFAAKRDRLRAALSGSAFDVPPAEGTYFQLIDFSRVPGTAGASDEAVAERLLTEAGIATIPLSPFYETPPRLTVLRLCIAKKDETLDEAAKKLRTFAGAA